MFCCLNSEIWSVWTRACERKKMNRKYTDRGRKIGDWKLSRRGLRGMERHQDREVYKWKNREGRGNRRGREIIQVVGREIEAKIIKKDRVSKRWNLTDPAAQWNLKIPTQFSRGRWRAAAHLLRGANSAGPSAPEVPKGKSTQNG